MPYMKVRRGEEWCVHKQGPGGQPDGESLGCHETEAEADTQIRAIEEREESGSPGTRARDAEWRFVDEFRVRNPREFFRILPVGKFNKFGRLVEITPDVCRDMVAHFRVVPPTRLPVNREHLEEHGRVGVISGLRQQADGLYAMVDWTSAGLKLLAEDSFGYFSPEIIWGPADYEGKTVTNVLYGLALTNHPYFGEQTAIYTLQDLTAAGGSSDPAAPDRHSDGGNPMNEEVVIDGLFARIGKAIVSAFSAPPGADPGPTPSPANGGPPPREQPGDPVRPEPAPTGGARRAELARIAALEKENAALRVRTRQADLIALMGEEFRPLAEKLALIEDQALADELAEEFHAFIVQADDSLLFGELGTAGGDQDAARTEAERYEAEVKRRVDKGMSAADAHSEVAAEHPELYKAYRRASARREED